VARLEVSIEVDRHDGASAAPPDGRSSLHVVGTVRRDGGTEVPFVGWTELLALIQQAVA
jgi:hypothetical protein